MVKKTTRRVPKAKISNRGIDQPAQQPEVVSLKELEATQLALCVERVSHAQTVLSVHQSEARALGQRLATLYSENGEYEVLNIDPAKGEVQRRRIKFRADDEPSSTKGSPQG